MSVWRLRQEEVGAVAPAVLAVLGRDGAAFATFACMPLVLCLFTLAGLYDRDELRFARSTLEEAPRLLQLLKRAFDIVVTSIGLVVIGPVIAVIAHVMRRGNV